MQMNSSTICKHQALLSTRTQLQNKETGAKHPVWAIAEEFYIIIITTVVVSESLREESMYEKIS
jgi:hypothetical protein